MSSLQPDLPVDTPFRPVPPRRQQSHLSHRNFGESAVQRNGPPLLTSWLELVVAPSWRLEQAQANIHPIDGLPHACYAIRLDQRWLCGESGALALFLSYEAATRFMRMLRVAHYHRAGRRKIGKEHSMPFQCFKLGGQGLGLCDQCGLEHCRQSSRADAADWEEDYP